MTITAVSKKKKGLFFISNYLLDAKINTLGFDNKKNLMKSL